jgi:polyisoprenoid-binding protein YceI
VTNNPYITFHSKKIVQTGPDTFEVDGDLTIRGVSKAEKLNLKAEGAEAVWNEQRNCVH